MTHNDKSGIWLAMVVDVVVVMVVEDVVMVVVVEDVVVVVTIWVVIGDGCGGW